MHVRLTKPKKLQKQDINTCVYSPVKPNTLKMDKSIISIVSPHEHCNHKHYCIFNENRTKLETDITRLEKQINNFENIKNAAINGEVIYHPELDSYYDINISSYTGVDGKLHYKTSVKLTDRFIGGVNRKIENLKYDLRNLINFRLNVLHGKIGGYSYGV